MNISGVGQTGGSWPVSRPTVDASAASSRPSGKIVQVPQDQLDISPAARLLMELENLSDSATSAERLELIEKIRSEIAQGKYDTDEKLELALQRFIQQEMPE